MNYFDTAVVAARYARSRPYFHPQVMEMLRAPLGGSVADALDVGCGTGQSTLALLGLAERVTGTDVSNAMLAEIEETPGIEFLQASAHQQPFADQSFDLITCCMAYHWFDQPAFLQEAKRLLKHNGALVIYNCYFPGLMANNEAFNYEMRRYYSAYPSPQRQANVPTADEAALAGFVGMQQSFEFWQAWALPQLIGYLTTQSNLIERAEQTGEAMGQIEGDLAQQFRGYFTAPTEHFLFKGDVSILRLER